MLVTDRSHPLGSDVKSIVNLTTKTRMTANTNFDEPIIIHYFVNQKLLFNTDMDQKHTLSYGV